MTLNEVLTLWDKPWTTPKTSHWLSDVHVKQEDLILDQGNLNNEQNRVIRHTSIALLYSPDLA